MSIDTLKENLGNLNEKDGAFASSMIKQFAKKGKLSDKQMYWVDVLTERAVTGYPEPAAKEALGDFKGVVDLLMIAKQKLKYPKIKLTTGSGLPVQLSVAGPNAKHPGTINVTDGGSYGSNLWYGRVHADGTWEKPHKLPTWIDAVAVLLKKLAHDPAGVATAYGKFTGHCCFCNRPLTDEKSTTVGYGPVCAESYGLPWGTTTVVDCCSVAETIAKSKAADQVIELRRTKKKMADEGDN